MSEKKYTNKSSAVKAIQYDGTNHEEIIAFTNGEAKYETAIGSSADGNGGTQSYSQLTLETTEGSVAAKTTWVRVDIITEGDYVVQFDGNKFYRQNKIIFENTHSLGDGAPDVQAFQVVNEGTAYLIPKYEVLDGVGISLTGNHEEINFVRGSKLAGEDVERHEGILHEGLLSVILYDLNYKNKLLPSRETSTAITNIEQGLLWIQRRGDNRKKAGTQGTYKK